MEEEVCGRERNSQLGGFRDRTLTKGDGQKRQGGKKGKKGEPSGGHPKLKGGGYQEGRKETCKT